MAGVITDEIKIRELLTRSVEKVFPSKEFLEQKLKSGEKLSVYLGIDPTGSDLHLGHSVQLFVLKRFQALGHKVFIVIGDFTAQIGDPTGKDLTRKPLTEKEVKKNSKRYKNQIAKVLDTGLVDFKYNSSWLGKLNFKDVVELGAHKTVQQLLDRDMFQRRIVKGESIRIHEFLYPLMQGYDSVALKIDGEIGGSDQTFNMLVGRDLVRAYLEKEKFVLTARLLVNPKTGEKMMSKTAGDYVSLGAPPQEMYSAIMSLPDEIVFEMFELCTDVQMEKTERLKSGPILAAKRELAYEITKIYHGEAKAGIARKEFDKIFRDKDFPQEVKTVKCGQDSVNIADLLIKSGFASSYSEAKRLISQGAVEVDNQKISDWNFMVGLKNSVNIKVGPRRFFRAVK